MRVTVLQCCLKRLKASLEQAVTQVITADSFRQRGSAASCWEARGKPRNVPDGSAVSRELGAGEGQESRNLLQEELLPRSSPVQGQRETLVAIYFVLIYSWKWRRGKLCLSTVSSAKRMCVLPGPMTTTGTHGEMRE